MTQKSKTFILLIFFISLLLLISLGQKEIKKGQTISLDNFLLKIKNNEIETITLRSETELEGITKNGKVFRATKDPGESLTQILKDYGLSSTTIFNLKINKETINLKDIILVFFFNILPFGIIAWIFWQFFKQAQRGTTQIFSFGKSGVKVYNPNDPDRITFKDVANLEEAKQELMEVVEFLKNPEKFFKIGARIPKGVLLVGPPGSGKTMLARATAAEAGVPFFYISGSEFVEMFVGVGASRVRDAFAIAKRNQPCLTGDSLITLKDGRKITIKEIFEKKLIGEDVLAFDESLRIKSAKIIGVTKTPKQQIIKIKTSISELKLTPNHLLPTFKDGQLEWEEAKKLKTSDLLAFPKKFNEELTKREKIIYETINSRNLINVSVERKQKMEIFTYKSNLLEFDNSFNDILWCQIKNIEELPKKEDVYDLILDKYHNFIANNHFVHNCILFIDELDAIGKIRGVGITGGHEEREQTLNQILVEMDGFEKGTKIVILSATNRADVLDPALLRPGRFDRKIVLELPDIKAREEILKIHLRDKRFSKLNLKQIAERTPGFSGADLANLCNEAAILAARRNKEFISQKELLDSIEKVLLGPERKTKVYSKKEKEIAAYHEAGHALVAHYLKYSNPVQKISIISRGRAGGYTLKLPTEEKSFYFKKEFLDELASMLGGYAAEKLIFNDITTGASNDLEVATDLAKQLVIRFGMSEKLGPISLTRKSHAFIGPEFFEKDYSEKTAEVIDEEVKNLINQALKRAITVLEAKKDKLEKLAHILIKKEVVEKKQFEKLIGEAKGSFKVTDSESN